MIITVRNKNDVKDEQNSNIRIIFSKFGILNFVKSIEVKDLLLIDIMSIKFWYINWN